MTEPARRPTEQSADEPAGQGTALPLELLDATSDCVMVLDADWRIAYLNAQAIAELGDRDLLGSSVWEAFPYVIGTKTESALRRVAATRKSEAFEALSASPSAAWYDVDLVPFGALLVVYFRNITKQRRAAEELLRRHNELDTVLSRAGVGIMQYAENHRLIVINDRFCKILGRTREELDGLSMEAFTHPDDIPGNVGLLNRHAQSETPFYLEKRYVRPNGEVVWCSVAISFVRHSETNEPTTIVVAREITDEVEARQKAADTQTLLRGVIDGAEDLIFVKDTQGGVVLANKKMTEDFGVSAGQAGGAQFPELSRRFEEQDQQVIRTGQRLMIEEEVPTPDGIRTFQTIKVPWQRDGVTKGVIAISRDISERVRNEQALRESEERFRLAALATGDAIWEWDLVRDTIVWSSSSASLTGESPGEGFDWWHERIHPDDREAVVNSLARFAEGAEQRWESEYRFLRASGSYGCILDRGFLLRDEAGNVVRMIGAMSDITERVEAQERINRLQAELVHISRISAMETMGSTLAHEINQPLTAAGNYLLGARRMIDAGEPLDSAEVKDGLRQAQAEITRAGEIVRRVRRMVEHGTAEMHPVPLLDSVGAALRMAIPAPHAAGITVSTDVPADVEVMADPVQLQQVLFNLLRNSAEAVANSERKNIGITAEVQAGEVVIRVNDRGEGVRPDIVDRLFSAFASTKPGGLGVGLSICRTIVEAHGGKIWAENRPGGGAVFAFTLRAAPAGEELSPAVAG
ncbi:PAS domain S-box protein [Altererythrobacter soli]|uniref:histidine kinase n=1 Tax=Croceibacterium soli TaxID=1739690 RepID=A0A6I4UUL3_9SPHN|nr:PAS domain S-box protein [Croceibacterium soli]MXP41494.1 PAS domain S-box protein [Croceibacterium soli]